MSHFDYDNLMVIYLILDLFWLLKILEICILLEEWDPGLLEEWAGFVFQCGQFRFKYQLKHFE